MLIDNLPSIQQQILSGLGEITSTIAAWTVPLAAIGSVSMAILQTIKTQTPVRAWYQRIRLRRWLRETYRGNFSGTNLSRFLKNMKTRKSLSKEERSTENSIVNEIERKIIALATSGDFDALYDLASDAMCDQIRKIVPLVLDYPVEHELVLRCLARGASSDDIELLLTAQRTSDEQEAKAAYRKVAAAKSRVLSQVRCSIDAIQTVIAFRWKFWLQSASMVLSAFLGALAIHLGILQALKASQSDGQHISTFWSAVLIGFLAGFLAPIARDLVATTEQWRSTSS